MKCVKFYGVPRREKRIDDIWQTCKFLLKYSNWHFGAEGYSVSTVGLNEATIRKYIEGKEKRDTALDQLSVREYEGPFKGGR